MMIPLRRRSTKHELRLLTEHVKQLEQKILDLSQQLACLSSLPARMPTTGPITPIPARPTITNRHPERRISKALLIRQTNEVISLDQADTRYEEFCGPLRLVGSKIVKHFHGVQWVGVDEITGECKSISVPLA